MIVEYRLASPCCGLEPTPLRLTAFRCPCGAEFGAGRARMVPDASGTVANVVADLTKATEAAVGVGGGWDGVAEALGAAIGDGNGEGNG